MLGGGEGLCRSLNIECVNITKLPLQAFCLEYILFKILPLF